MAQGTTWHCALAIAHDPFIVCGRRLESTPWSQ
jgi:hypothetical protein